MHARNRPGGIQIVQIFFPLDTAYSDNKFHLGRITPEQRRSSHARCFCNLRHADSLYFSFNKNPERCIDNCSIASLFFLYLLL